MDWMFHHKFTGLTVQGVQLKIDELNRERPTVPVCKYNRLDMNSTYTIETWFHFNANTLIAIIYRDLIYDNETEGETVSE